MNVALAFAVAGLLTSAPAAAPSSAPAPAVPLLRLVDPAGMARFDSSKAKVDFFRLANEFEAQTNKAYCGPTTAAIVLNALRAGKTDIVPPEDPSLLPPEASALPPKFDALFHRYTQNDFFDAKTDTVKTKAQVFGRPKSTTDKSDPGLQLRQLAGMLETKGVAVTLRVVDAGLSEDTIRKELIANLATPDDYAIVNFARSALGQAGGGHISPLGAYDEASDSFLVLDVNAADHDWTWVPARSLIAAMRTFDTVENRGYLLVRE